MAKDKDQDQAKSKDKRGDRGATPVALQAGGMEGGYDENSDVDALLDELIARAGSNADPSR